MNEPQEHLKNIFAADGLTGLERRHVMEVISEIARERGRQLRKWGKQRHPWPTWLYILVEEVGELAQAMQAADGQPWVKETDDKDLYTEALHVAAVASAIAEHALELKRLGELTNGRTQAKRDEGGTTRPETNQV